MALHNLLLLLTVCLAVTALQNKKPVTSPPRIKAQAPIQIPYKEEEEVELPCAASGEPHPEYRWYKDGLPLEIDGLDIRRTPGVGTITILSPKAKHEGVYQCWASNSLGTALSVKTTLKLAVLHTFPTVTEPKTLYPTVGNDLTLKCEPPFSFPSGLVYWAKFKAGSKFVPLETNARVSTDYKGNLHISNVVPEDDLKGMNYICIVQNDRTRSSAQGEDTLVMPQSAGPTPNYAAPELMWQSDSPVVVLEGQEHRMKCIFSGYPTPSVRWERVGRALPAHSHVESHGQELVIDPSVHEDAGEYRCLANNTKHGAPVSRKFQLRVESTPRWTTAPDSVDSSEEENAEFHCAADGVPKPTILWSVNGQPFDTSDERVQLINDVVYFTNLTKSDAQVLQCNASNKHGYIFQNAYLNVLAEPPTFTSSPETLVKVAEGQNINLTCRVFGAPKPLITWKKSDQAVSGTRFQRLKSGDLQILNIQRSDDGFYECHAWNKFGEEARTGQLIVRERTRIERGPSTQTVNASEDVTLECVATTDPFEVNKLKIEWRRNKLPIDFQKEGRVSMNMVDNSITIQGAQVVDSAEYTCHASNGLDEDEATARLTVRDRPAPPYDVGLDECTSSNARITWEPSSDNNDPILDFTVYYNTSFDEPGEFTVGAEGVPPGRNMANIELSAWVNYTFHVKARNSLGFSDPSTFTIGYCTTPPRIPLTNPANVCSLNGQPDELIVTWEPMDRMEHNGEGFHYLVGYVRKDQPGAAPMELEVHDYRQGRVAIEGQPTFREYEVYVQAKNEKGRSPQHSLDRKTAFSGEDSPLDEPQQFQLDESSLNATTAIFLWEPVEQDPLRVRGQFLGYQIVYWRAENPDEKRLTKVIMGEYQPCPDVAFRHRRQLRHRRQHDAGLVKGHVNDLWPYSQIQASVQVMNTAGGGKMSEVFEFDTPEGLAGPVPFLEVTERGSHHFGLRWMPPASPNGLIGGYVIKYRPVDVMNEDELLIYNPLQLSAKLTNLQPETKYIIYIAAQTGPGEGSFFYIEDQTGLDMPPDMPGFNDIEYGDTSLNVSWSPTADNEQERNPGQEFYVEIRKAGEEEWSPTDPEEDKHWANITDLEPGESYEIRIVAVNGGGDERRSEPRSVVVGPKYEHTQQEIATAGWFIGTLCFIILLLIIILIICLIKRNRGGKYPVHEKEKLRGRDPEKDEDDPAFGEYTRTDYPEKDPDRDSLDSHRPMGSETDSLSAYGEPDTTGFDEDGSFIKQYGNKQPGNEHTNNAFSTFV